MLNTEVRVLANLYTQGQKTIFKNIHFKNTNKTVIIFKVWERSGGVFWQI